MAVSVPQLQELRYLRCSRFTERGRSRDTCDSRYDQPDRHPCKPCEHEVTMTDPGTADIEQRLDAGEELQAGAVAQLLGVDVATIHRWRKAEKIKHRRRGGIGQYVFDPADVRRLLDESRRTRGGDGQSPSA
jgi:hypothetical protein